MKKRRGGREGGRNIRGRKKRSWEGRKDARTEGTLRKRNGGENIKDGRKLTFKHVVSSAFVAGTKHVPIMTKTATHFPNPTIMSVFACRLRGGGSGSVIIHNGIHQRTYFLAIKQKK
jgi:hypothetical protein